MAMATKLGSIALIMAGVALFTTRVYAAQNATVEWECKKDGKVVEVSGDDAAAKKANCKQQAGKWVKKQTAGSTKGW
jgi:hypothetical protein